MISIPSFKALEAGISQVKDAFKARKWEPLVLWFLIAVVFMVGIILTFIKLYHSAFSNETNSTQATKTTIVTTSVATATQTIYAPQIINNSSGVTQIQGSGNTIITKPDPKPVTEYSLKTASELREDGLYHARIEVRIAFPKKGYLEISPKLKCAEPDDKTSAPVSRSGDPNYYVGIIWRMDCISAESIVEGVGYFLYKNME